MRFSEEELDLARERAALAGLAVGAWIGQTVIGAALHGSQPVVGLPDLLRLHADVAALDRFAGVASRCPEVAEMFARLDAAIDGVVAELGRTRR